MELEQYHFAPFDRTYADVTAQIEREASNLISPDIDWLQRLMVTFQQEREKWNDRSELTDYRVKWSAFRSRILRLVAGAYLHIGYDLPRVLANDWPGNGRWASGPNMPRGREIYFRLRGIFPNSIVRSSRDAKIVGMPAIFLRRASRRALTGSASWVDNLRQGAWIHADILASSPDRPDREAAMARAMTAALEDVSLLHPWSILHLGPPHDAFFAQTWASLAAIGMVFRSLLEFIVMTFLLSRTTKLWIEKREKLNGLDTFIYAWGSLLSDYLALAVRDPQGFDAYRARRRQELGIESNLVTTPI